MTGLLGSTVLEVAIGIVFVYLLLALLCTAVNEWIAGLFKTRSKLLEQGIAQILAPEGAQSAAGQTILKEFYGHPMVQALMRDNAHPSYLPVRTFAKTIMDLATPNHAGNISFSDLESGIKNDLPDGKLKTALLATIGTGEKNIDDAQKAIEGWYNDSMDRVSGWYKRRTQVWTLIVASILIVATNADTIHIAQRLWLEPTLRSQFVEAAKTAPAVPAVSAVPGQAAPVNPQATSTVSDQAAQELGHILGWKDLGNTKDPLSWFERVVGWILTIIAVSLGAPFWFDALNGFMNLRSAGKSPEENNGSPKKT